MYLLWSLQRRADFSLAWQSTAISVETMYRRILISGKQSFKAFHCSVM